MITLSAAAIEAFQVGGTAIETNDSASAMHPQLDVNLNRITFTVTKGRAIGGLFTPGTHGSNVGVTLDATSGTWSASNGMSGTLTPTEIASIQNFIKNLRNGIETLC